MRITDSAYKKIESYPIVDKPTKIEFTKIYELAKTCDISRSDVDEGMRYLGYETALLYTQFFVENSLCGNLYLNGIRTIIDKTVSLKELRRLVKEKSDLEIVVDETIKKFNFNKKQLEQIGYRRKNHLTGKSESGDDVRRGHDYEHRLSRTDRQQE